MELTHFQMYLITRVDTISFMLFMYGAFSLVVGLVVLLVQATVEDASDWVMKVRSKRIVLIGGLSMLLCAMLPTKSDIALIYAVPAIVNNQDVQSIPPELAKLARVKLEEMVKEAVTK